MIISHKYKFIFIKTTKTAGTSVEVDLSKVLDSSDVATPIIPAIKGHTAQNFTWRKYGLFKCELYNHMTARSVRDYIGKKKFNDYFVFCVEREPIEKCISHFSMLKNSPIHNEKTKGLSIEDYIQIGNYPIDTNKYTDVDGSLLVDRILRYENLAEELREIGDILGFNVNLQARAKAGFRENAVLTAEQKSTIYEAFKSSNIFTGYRL